MEDVKFLSIDDVLGGKLPSEKQVAKGLAKSAADILENEDGRLDSVAWRLAEALSRVINEDPSASEAIRLAIYYPDSCRMVRMKIDIMEE